MNTEVIAEQDPDKKVLGATPFPQSPWGKLVYGLFIVVMPILAFWATELFKPEWQTGRFSDYLILLLFPEASLLFFLLMAYSVVCYWLLLIDPGRYSQKYLIRFGIYTSVLLALQYSVSSSLYFFYDSRYSWSILYLIVLWLLPVFLPRIYRSLVNRWDTKAVNTVSLTLVIAIFLISALLMKSPLFPSVLILAGVTMAAPFWCFLIALRAAIWLIKKYEFRLTFLQGLGLVAWIAGYAAAWRFDILKMYELYAALPAQPPPDCYIATAAAQGHPQIVGSWFLQRRNGVTMRVNKQLQILKCTELAMMAIHPSFHKVLRKVYDIAGRSLARKMRNPLLADLAYLLLKPWEWLARLILRMILPEIDLISKKIYTI